MLPHPCILGYTQTKGEKIRIGCLTPAFSGAQKRAEMQPHPCILGYPQTKRDKIRIGCLTLAFSRAQRRTEMLPHPCVLRGSPNKGGQNQNWLPHPCLLEGSKEGGNATSPLHSWRVLKQRGTKSGLAA